jgi:hypothetical protein
MQTRERLLVIPRAIDLSGEMNKSPWTSFQNESLRLDRTGAARNVSQAKSNICENRNTVYMSHNRARELVISQATTRMVRRIIAETIADE